MSIALYGKGPHKHGATKVDGYAALPVPSRLGHLTRETSYQYPHSSSGAMNRTDIYTSGSLQEYPRLAMAGPQ